MQIKQRGFTLLEMIICIAILGIVLAIAIPSFLTMIESQRVKASLANLQSDVTFSKNEALKQNKRIYFRLTKTSASDWCVGISSNSACDCKTAVSSCDLYTRTENKAQLSSNAVALYFDNIRTLPTVTTSGVSLPIQITLASGSGSNEKNGALSLNPVGKTSLCSPTPSKAVSGLSAC